jgi:hypothetical protein
LIVILSERSESKDPQLLFATSPSPLIRPHPTTPSCCHLERAKDLRLLCNSRINRDPPASTLPCKHAFSRAANAPQKMRASAPAARLQLHFRIIGYPHSTQSSCLSIIGDPHSDQSSSWIVILSERSESKDPQLLFATPASPLTRPHPTTPSCCHLEQLDSP